jgi:hypothetical protein
MKAEEMIKEMRASQTDVSAKWEDVFNMSYVPVYLNFDWGLNSDGTIPCLRYVAPYTWNTAHYSLEKRIAEGVWIPFSLNAEDIFHGNWEKVNMYDLDPSDSNDTYQRWRQEDTKEKVTI